MIVRQIICDTILVEVLRNDLGKEIVDRFGQVGGGSNLLENSFYRESAQALMPGHR